MPEPTPASTAADWATFWRWEILRRRLQPLDFRRWKADSSRALRALPAGQDRDGRPPRVLDASCGLGYHAIVQAELGFAVEACDADPRVLAEARRNIDTAGVAVPTFEARWEELGSTHPHRYDLVFNDEVHQVRDRDALLAVLRGFAGTLRPGGSLVFFFAEAAKPDDGANVARWEWERTEPVRTAWTLQDDRRRVELTVRAHRVAEDAIVHEHRYAIEEAGSERLEVANLLRNYRWDWNAILPVLREAGFDRFESHQRTNVHGHDFALNLARTPG